MGSFILNESEGVRYIDIDTNGRITLTLILNLFRYECMACIRLTQDRNKGRLVHRRSDIKGGKLLKTYYYITYPYNQLNALFD